MRKTTKRSKKVKEILYSTFRGNLATVYGSKMEETSREEYCKYLQQKGCSDVAVERCRLRVSIKEPWFAASPDGIVRDPCNTTHPSWLLEIKNPYSSFISLLCCLN